MEMLGTTNINIRQANSPSEGSAVFFKLMLDLQLYLQPYVSIFLLRFPQFIHHLQLNKAQSRALPK
jgi:hypothetical protein